MKKRNKGDFALWKFVDKKSKTEPGWKTPLGYGRPGWHIEDTAISEKFFGPQYDLHGGGFDLKFPHHEAEIAQQEAASGKKPFVKIWMHVGLLDIHGRKMAKSLKNFVTIREFLKKNPPEIAATRIFLTLEPKKIKMATIEKNAAIRPKAVERGFEPMKLAKANAKANAGKILAVILVSLKKTNILKIITKAA